MDAVTGILHRTWWVFLLQGLVGLVLGILALVLPGITLAALTLFFGLFVLLSGIFEIIAAFVAVGNRQTWGWRLAVGVLGILAGVAILRWPGITAHVVLLLVAGWAIASGIIGIVEAISERATMRHAWLAALLGVVSVLFGIAMVVWPVVGLLAVAYLVGIYAIVFGLINCVIAFRLVTLPERRAGLFAPPGAMPSH